jgi:hypothetical protein
VRTANGVSDSRLRACTQTRWLLAMRTALALRGALPPFCHFHFVIPSAGAESLLYSAGVFTRPAISGPSRVKSFVFQV